MCSGAVQRVARWYRGTPRTSPDSATEGESTAPDGHELARGRPSARRSLTCFCQGSRGWSHETGVGAHPDTQISTPNPVARAHSAARTASCGTAPARLSAELIAYSDAVTMLAWTPTPLVRLPLASLSTT